MFRREQIQTESTSKTVVTQPKRNFWYVGGTRAFEPLSEIQLIYNGIHIPKTPAATFSVEGQRPQHTAIAPPSRPLSERVLNR